MATQLSFEEQLHAGSAEGSKDGKRSATRVHVGVWDEPVSAAVACLAGEAATPYATAHPDNAALIVTNVSAVPQGDGTCHLVTTKYESQESDAPAVLPWEEPDDIGFELGEGSEPWFRDAKDKPYVNKAGEPFEDLPERDTCELVASVNRNTLTVDLKSILKALNKTNANPFTLDGVQIGKGEAKLSGASIKRAFHETQRYYQLGYKLKLRESWKVQVENRGTNELKDGKLVAIVKGTPPTQVEKPYPLNDDGTKMAEPTDVPTQIEFEPYKETSYRAFDFQ